LALIIQKFKVLEINLHQIFNRGFGYWTRKPKSSPSWCHRFWMDGLMIGSFICGI
jgi:hypothetical protein